MAPYYIPEGLLLHLLVIGTVLTLIFFRLYRRHLFHYLSAGFWAWAAFALYFFITPLVQFIGNPYFVETRIVLTEGLPRMVWVTFFVAVGIATFFWGYFRTQPGKPRFGLDQQALPRGTWIVIILALLAAGYALITYRGAFGTERAQYEVVQSKHVGDVTGYETILYYFANFPIILLLFHRKTRIIGLALLGLMLVGKLGDKSDRASAVSLFLAATMALTTLRRRKWPPIRWVVVVLIFTLLMHARGHMSITEFQESGRMTLAYSRYEVNRGEGAVMLSTLYLKSYIHDQAGYTYGVPFASAVLFGALPRKYFPWKDWLVEGRFNAVHRAFALEPLMYGGKSTIIGDLYGFGGVFAVAIGMFIIGFLVRKLDGWLTPQAPLAVRVLGIVWLSSFWIMFGSSLLWCAGGLYINAVPFVGVVLCSKLFGTARRRPMSEPKFLLQR